MDSLDPNFEALCSVLPPDEANDLREERAAMLEYCGGFTRQESERRAGLSPTGGRL